MCNVTSTNENSIEDQPIIRIELLKTFCIALLHPIGKALNNSQYS